MQPLTSADPIADAGRVTAHRGTSLWPWRGWHAVVVGDEVAGVYFDPADALRAVLAMPANTDAVGMFRIGGPSAVAVPPADGPASLGGPVPPPADPVPAPASAEPWTPTCHELIRRSASACEGSIERLAATDGARRRTLAAIDQSRAAVAESHRILAALARPVRSTARPRPAGRPPRSGKPFAMALG